MSPTEREQRVLSIFRKWRGCTKCGLGELREQKKLKTDGTAGRIVMPDGNVDADMVIIGIGPGEEEDLEGAPFIGPSGDILNEYLEAVKIDRRSVFVMNIVQCRPFSISTDERSGRKREENRDPSSKERAACRPFWEEVLYEIDPLLVVAMGKPAVLEVTGQRSVTMRNVQGQVQHCVIRGKATDVTYPVMSMYHPAFLARSGDKRKIGVWGQALVAWRRAAYLLDKLRQVYWDTPMPDRGYKMRDMFLVQGGLLT